MIGELQEAVFFSVANLLNLEVDILFFDTSSTYWETETADDALLDDDDTGDDAARAVEGAWRRHGRSKDFRPDLLTELREESSQFRAVTHLTAISGTSWSSRAQCCAV